MQKDKLYLGSIIVTATIFISLILIYCLFVNLHWFTYHLLVLIIIVPISLTLTIIPAIAMKRTSKEQYN